MLRLCVEEDEGDVDDHIAFVEGVISFPPVDSGENLAICIVRCQTEITRGTTSVLTAKGNAASWRIEEAAVAQDGRASAFEVVCDGYTINLVKQLWVQVS